MGETVGFELRRVVDFFMIIFCVLSSGSSLAAKLLSLLA